MALFFKAKMVMPTSETALPGRSEPITGGGMRHYVNCMPLKGPYPQGSEIALFGRGCF